MDSWAGPPFATVLLPCLRVIGSIPNSLPASASSEGSGAWRPDASHLPPYPVNLIVVELGHSAASSSGFTPLSPLIFFVFSTTSSSSLSTLLLIYGCYTLPSMKSSLSSRIKRRVLRLVLKGRTTGTSPSSPHNLPMSLFPVQGYYI